MTALVITVDFKLKPGTMSAFRQLVDRNAADSCRDEPGCRRFDVLAPFSLGERVFLYEIYDSRGAFEAHLKTRHFIEFNRASAAMVLAKRVSEYMLVCGGSYAPRSQG